MAKKSLRELNLTHSAQGHLISVHYPPHYKWDGSQEPVLLIGGVHGDEPEGVDLAEQFLNWLDETCADLSQNKKLEKTVPWLVITCLNPDGYFAKPRTRVNSNGVDLNRNFPAKDWAPTAKAPRYNPGPSPCSEPEVRSLAALIQKEKPQLIIHCHSTLPPCVVYTGEPGRAAAEILSKHSGYLAKPDIGYPCPGSLGEFGWLDCKTPVICVEEAETMERAQTWLHFKDGLSELFFETSNAR